MRRALAAAAACAVVAAGCSIQVGGTAATPRAPSGTYLGGGVCWLVSDAEIAAIAGRDPIGGGGGFELGGWRNCTWTLYLDPVESVVIGLTSAQSYRDDRKLWGDTASAVRGLGDEAYWVDSMDTLNILVGAQALSVSMFGDRFGSAEARAIAEKALPRLSP